MTEQTKEASRFLQWSKTGSNPDPHQLARFIVPVFDRIRSCLRGLLVPTAFFSLLPLCTFKKPPLQDV